MTDSSKWKIVLDPVHGVIELDPLAVQIIDTREFQRLRLLKQLGCTDYVYPGATHTRFAHSIGVYYLTSKMIDGLRRWAPDDPSIKLNDWEEECIRIAALCHDLGHGPFSHLYEEICKESHGLNWRWRHEDVSCALMKRIFQNNESIRRQLKQGNKSIRLIMRLIMGKKISDMNEDEKKKAYIYQIVSNKENSIDVDKWDYLCRDAMYCGMNERFLSERAIMGARVVKTSKSGKPPVHQIGYPEKDAMMFYNMFQTRYTLHRYIYQHRVIVGMNLMVKDIFKHSESDSNNVFNFELFPLDQTSKIPDKDDDLDDFIESFTEKEKIQTEKYLRLTDEIISRIRFISEQTGYSQDSPIAGAIQTLQRIDTRDFYTLYCEIHLERGTKYKAALQAKNECVQRLRLVDNSFSEYAAVELISFNYGMKDENPMKKLIFYNKRNPASGCFQGRTLPRNKVSHLLPELVSEYYIRLYVKECDKGKRENLKEKIGQTIKEFAEKYDTGSTLSDDEKDDENVSRDVEPARSDDQTEQHEL